MSNTPRFDACVAVEDIILLCKKLETELNAANEEINRLCIEIDLMPDNTYEVGGINLLE